MDQITISTLTTFTLFLFIYSSNSMACGDSVDFSVPHIHDEQALITAIENTQHSKLKQLDMQQVYAGELSLSLEEVGEENKVNQHSFNRDIGENIRGHSAHDTYNNGKI